MPRAESKIEEWPTPEGAYLRRGGVLGPAELIVYGDGRLLQISIKDDWLLQIIADAAHILATRPKG